MPDTDDRVLFLGPTKMDATAATALMAGAGLACHPCASLDELCREIPNGVGIVVLPQ